MTQNTVKLTNTRGNTPAEGRPRIVFRRDTVAIEQTVCAAHMHWICSGVIAASCRTTYFHCDVRDSGFSVEQVNQLVHATGR